MVVIEVAVTFVKQIQFPLPVGGYFSEMFIKLISQVFLEISNLRHFASV